MDDLILEKTALALAASEHCATWTADARPLFRMGARPWKDVLQAPVVALHLFHQLTGEPMTLFVACHAWTNQEHRPGTLVSLYFATDAAVSREQLETLGRPLTGLAGGWASDGIHAVPDYGFPVLQIQEGRLYHVWEREPDAPPFSTIVVARGPRARPERVTWDSGAPQRFLDDTRHAVGRIPTVHHGDRQLREQLKLAWAYRVAERVIEADGQILDDERAFLLRSFPPEQLEALWLDDLALRDQLAERAETELRDLIGYHEKLGLLSTFFGACYADGTLAVQELKVLKEASQALGLDRGEVVNYLQKLW